MPPELQNYRLGGGTEQEHREKAYRRTGRKAAHHHRADHCHHEERPKAQRHLALYHPPDSGGGGVPLPTATDTLSRGNVPSKGTRKTRKTRPNSRVENQAGERVGVVNDPRLASQRTATPTAQGFSAVLEKEVNWGCSDGQWAVIGAVNSEKHRVIRKTIGAVIGAVTGKENYYGKNQ